MQLKYSSSTATTPTTQGQPQKRQRHRGWLWLDALCIVLLALCLALADLPFNPHSVEKFYAQGLYPAVAEPMMAFSSSLPFSLSAALLLLVSLGYSMFLWQNIRKLRWLRLLRGSLYLSTVLAVSFYGLWGMNYHRLSLAEHLALQVRGIQLEDLEALADDLLIAIERDLQLIDVQTLDASALTAEVALELTSFLQEHGIHSPTLPSTVKILPKGSLIVSGNATGVISPWLLEAHLDGALPPSSQLMVAAHELAHLAGFAHEADAELLATLVGLASERPEYRYAAQLKLFRFCLRDMPSALRKRYQEALLQAALDDWRQGLLAYERYRVPRRLERLQHRFYDSFLKSQGISEGTASYSRGLAYVIVAREQGLVTLEGF